MQGDQQVVVVDQDFICRAIINEVYRLGRWEHARPAHCRIVFAMPEVASKMTLLEAMSGTDFPLRFCAELRPMYSEEEVTSAVDCG